MHETIFPLLHTVKQSAVYFSRQRESAISNMLQSDSHSIIPVLCFLVNN